MGLDLYKDGFEGEVERFGSEGREKGRDEGSGYFLCIEMEGYFCCSCVCVVPIYVSPIVLCLCDVEDYG